MRIKPRVPTSMAKTLVQTKTPKPTSEEFTSAVDPKLVDLGQRIRAAQKRHDLRRPV